MPHIHPSYFYKYVQVKLRRRTPQLTTQSLKNWVRCGKQIVITSGPLCLPFLLFYVDYANHLRGLVGFMLETDLMRILMFRIYMFYYV